LSKYYFYIALFFFSFSLYGQESVDSKKESTWKTEKDKYNFEKDKKYKGPKTWNNDRPSSIREEAEDKTEDYYNGIEYNPQKIKKNRKKKKKHLKNRTGNGSGGYDPELDEDDPVEIPEDDEPEEEKESNTSFSVSPIWNYVFYCIVFALIILLAYQLIKNRKPKNKELSISYSEKEWNPELISKTELELLLEKSIESENFRECVRVYFTFILKEIIKKGWIKWKQEKTNFNYILEMKTKPDASQFEECVRVYELVWYGQYQIDKTHFEAIQPILLNYYHSLLASE
jgi:hypothetical protein